MMNEPRVCVVSSERPGNVPAMEENLGGLSPTWYVPMGQGGDYLYAGATGVREVKWPDSTYPLVAQRNAALEDSFGEGHPCVFLDDDLRAVKLAEPGESNTKVEVTVAEAIGMAIAELEARGLKLAGAAPTDNAYFCRRAITLNGFVRDGFTVHLPHDHRYDEALPLKLDYDMTLQHLHAYGAAVRIDTLLMTFQQRAKKGGCSYRSPELEEQCIDHLLAKWPGSIKRHAKRDHEVTIVWPPR
jgi:hypothetical protein